MTTLKHQPRKHGDPRTTGRQETAAERRDRRRGSQLVARCEVDLCKRRAERVGLCGRHRIVAGF